MDGSSAGFNHEKIRLPAVSLPRPVVYTAITGDYDTLKEQPHAAANQASFVAFVDQPCASETWNSCAIHSAFSDANRNAKVHKILSHEYFPEAACTLWIDGSVTIRSADSVQRLIDAYLTDCDLVVFRHRTRTCVYQEASVCLQRRLDEPEVIWQQICRYTRDGYPSNAGLAECSVILRRHTAAVARFNEAWWEEIERGSRRDQLSFDYVARKVGLRYGFFPGTIANNPWFHRGAHADRESMPAANGTALPAASALSLLQTLPAPTDATVEERVVGEGGDARPPRWYRSASGNGRRRSVAFGRVRDKPSWTWVGFDMARALSKHYDVILYDSTTRPPACDVLFHLKKQPSPVFLSRVRQNGTKLVYCPIDVYQSPLEIEHDADLLRSCAALLVHCERLLPLLRPYCAAAHFVDHHTRYALNEMVDYKERGFILWIGSCSYLPYVLRWLEHNPIAYELKILTDLDNDRARRQAVEYAAEIGMAIDIPADATSFAGHRVYRWSEQRQQEMMRACKAALDVKMTTVFNQFHKPPTKAQQYVASGIPCAMNTDSYSTEYFRARSFELVCPTDTERWLSREYWETTRIAGERLRADTSIEAVAEKYRAIIESL